MKVLITGGAGFVGRHLTSELEGAGHDVIVTGLAKDVGVANRNLVTLDITDRAQCLKVVDDHKPSAIIHLAGLAHTALHDSNPTALYDVNVGGAVNIACAMAQSARKRPDLNYTMLFISTAFVYGGERSSERLSCSEVTQTVPRTNYGLSKLLAESSVRFFERDNFKVYIARPFNHIGPGQDPSFAVPAFASRIRDAAEGGVIETGDLTALRDFTDVRDIARAYRKILEIRPQETTFVLGRGSSVSMADVLDQLLQISGKKLHHRINPSLLRNSKEAEIVADASLALRVLIWRPEIPLEETLRSVWQDIQP